MSATGRKHEHVERISRSRRARSVVFFVALILAIAIGIALWSAAGVGMLVRAWEAIR